MFTPFFEKLLANPITMIDLETLDVSPRSAVLSIGAIVFDFRRMEVLRTYEATLMLEDQMAEGRTVKTSTVHWWLNQSPGARMSITNASPLARKLIPHAQMLQELKLFIPVDGLVIAKPAMFDIAILNDMHGGDLFNYRRAFDMHSLCTVIDPRRELSPSNPVAHSALHDARWQLEWLVSIVQKMHGWAYNDSHIPTKHPWPEISHNPPILFSRDETQ